MPDIARLCETMIGEYLIIEGEVEDIMLGISLLMQDEIPFTVSTGGTCAIYIRMPH